MFTCTACDINPVKIIFPVRRCYVNSSFVLTLNRTRSYWGEAITAWRHLTRHVNTLIAINTPPGVFASFFSTFAAVFTTRVPVYRSWSKSCASTLPFPHVLAFRCWRSTSVIKLFELERRQKKIMQDNTQVRSDISLDGTEVLPEKSTQQATNIMMLLLLAVHVSGLSRTWWLTCKDLTWNTALIRIWPLIWSKLCMWTCSMTNLEHDTTVHHHPQG